MLQSDGGQRTDTHPSRLPAGVGPGPSAATRRQGRCQGVAGRFATGREAATSWTLQAGFTDAGWEAKERVEAVTDELMVPVAGREGRRPADWFLAAHIFQDLAYARGRLWVDGRRIHRVNRIGVRSYSAL
jgi:hypothetical protein